MTTLNIGPNIGRFQWAAPVLAAALVAAACSSSASDITEAAELTTTTTAAPDTTNGDIETTDVETSDAPSDDTEPVDGEPQPMPDPLGQQELQILWEYVVGDHIGLIESDLGYSPVLLEPGTYDTDSMFTPMQFTVAEHTRLIVERHTFMVLVDHSAGQLWEAPLMEWKRPHKLTDPADTANGPPEWPGFIEGWDFDAWFAAHPALDVERTEMTISGIESVRYDVSFDGDADVGWDCGGRLCVPLYLDYGGPFDLESDEVYRIWVIPQEDFDPIMAMAVADASDGWGEFGDRVDAIIESVQLGQPQPVGFAENIWEAASTGSCRPESSNSPFWAAWSSRCPRSTSFGRATTGRTSTWPTKSLMSSRRTSRLPERCRRSTVHRSSLPSSSPI